MKFLKKLLKQFRHGLIMKKCTSCKMPYIENSMNRHTEMCQFCCLREHSSLKKEVNKDIDKKNLQIHMEKCEDKP